MGAGVGGRFCARVRYICRAWNATNSPSNPRSRASGSTSWLARQGLPWSRSQITPSHRGGRGAPSAASAVRTPSRKLRASERVVLRAAAARRRRGSARGHPARGPLRGRAPHRHRQAGGHGGAPGDVAPGGHAGQRAAAPLRRLARGRRRRAAPGHRAPARQGHLGRHGGGQGRADAGGAAGAVPRARARAQVPGARRGRGRRARHRSRRSTGAIRATARSSRRRWRRGKRAVTHWRVRRAAAGRDASSRSRSRPGARTRSACTSPITAIRSSAIGPTGGRRARRCCARWREALGRQALHAHVLGITHPATGKQAALVDAAAGRSAGGARDSCARRTLTSLSDCRRRGARRAQLSPRSRRAPDRVAPRVLKRDRDQTEDACAPWLTDDAAGAVDRVRAAGAAAAAGAPRRRAVPDDPRRMHGDDDGALHRRRRALRAAGGRSRSAGRRAGAAAGRAAAAHRCAGAGRAAAVLSSTRATSRRRLEAVAVARRARCGASARRSTDSPGVWGAGLTVLARHLRRRHHRRRRRRAASTLIGWMPIIGAIVNAACQTAAARRRCGPSTAWRRATGFVLFLVGLAAGPEKLERVPLTVGPIGFVGGGSASPSPAASDSRYHCRA